MKKVVSIILTLAIMLTVLPFGLFSITTGASEMYLYKDCGTYNWVLCDGVLTFNIVSDEEAFLPIDYWDDFLDYDDQIYWIDYRGYISEIECITSNYITTITIPNSVNEIEDGIFSRCTFLSDVYYYGTEEERNNINFGSNNDYLINATWHYLECEHIFDDSIDRCCNICGKNRFDKSGTTGDCIWTLNGTVLTVSGKGRMDDYNNHPWGYDITEVIFEDGVTHVGDNAFTNCSSLKKITFGNDVTRIGNYTFAGCSSLTEVTIGDNVTSIGLGAFTACSNLTSVTFNNKIKQITGYVFDSCGFTEITIPSSVEYISGDVFWNCQKLSNIYVDSENSNYISVDGVLFNKDMTEIVCYPVGKKADSYIIPNTVTTIGLEAFRSCNLKSISIPQSVTTIGPFAFSYCNNFTDVNYDGSIIEREKINILNDNDELINATWHYAKECPHEYNNTCDTTCNYCDAVRKINHTYDNVCDEKCNVCGFIRIVEDHTYDDILDSTCNKCGYVRDVHVHFYDGDCDTTCNTCGEVREAGEHIFGEWIIEDKAKPGIKGSKYRECLLCFETEEEEISAIDKVRFAGASLTLSDNIAINFKVNPTYLNYFGYSDIYIVCEFNGKTYTINDYTNRNNYLNFEFKEISPRMMYDTVTATVYGVYDGVAYECQSASYSVVQYAREQITSSNKKLKTLLVDMLNYGSMSQIYFNYNTDKLSNSWLSDAQKSFGTQNVREYLSNLNTSYATIENPAIKWSGASLVLKDSIAINYLVNFINITDTDGIYAVFESESGSWEIPFESFDLTVNNRYKINLNQLKAAQLGEVIYATIYDKNGNAISNTVSYSVESYAYAQKNSTSNVKLINLVDAMMKYVDSTYNYIAYAISAYNAK